MRKAKQGQIAPFVLRANSSLPSGRSRVKTAGKAPSLRQLALRQIAHAKTVPAGRLEELVVEQPSRIACSVTAAHILSLVRRSVKNATRELTRRPWAPTTRARASNAVLASTVSPREEARRQGVFYAWRESSRHRRAPQHLPPAQRVQRESFRQLKPLLPVGYAPRASMPVLRERHSVRPVVWANIRISLVPPAATRARIVCKAHIPWQSGPTLPACAFRVKPGNTAQPQQRRLRPHATTALHIHIPVPGAWMQ